MKEKITKIIFNVLTICMFLSGLCSVISFLFSSAFYYRDGSYAGLIAAGVALVVDVVFAVPWFILFWKFYSKGGNI